MKRVNFRPILFAAMGVVFGIFLYFTCQFESLRAYDFVFCALFCYFFIFRPFVWRRVLLLFLVFVFFCGAGALSAHLFTQNYFTGLESGEYTVEGTAVSVVNKRGYANVVLEGVELDGIPVSGKLCVKISAEWARVGDVLSFREEVTRYTREEVFRDEDKLYYFIEDIRYGATVDEAERAGESGNPFLQLNGALYDALHANMPKDDADVSYALLTGSGGSMDETLADAVQKGGIAHIFAVSGLHIGILFTAVYLISFPLKRWRFIPPFLVAMCYCALCSFTVSSIRAVIMCTVGGVLLSLGKKKDFIEGIALASLVVLLLFPAEWLSAGFRLSFGACVGLALFSGGFARALQRLRLPKFLSAYLASSLAVQIFTFPVLIECFGYFSLWGTLLNFFVIPALPALFLGLILTALGGLLFPAAAGTLLSLPSGLIGVMNYAFSAANLTAVLTGFSMGASGVVWLTACVGLSERVYFKPKIRALLAGGFALLFILCLLFENLVFFGCKIICYQARGCSYALVRTPTEAVLVLGEDATLSDCQEFLSKQYAGELTAIVLLGEGTPAFNVAAFLPSESIYAMREQETGLRETTVLFQEEISLGSLFFRYYSPERALLYAEDSVVELCFSREGAFSADLFVGEGCGDLIFYLAGDIIIER